MLRNPPKMIENGLMYYLYGQCEMKTERKLNIALSIKHSVFKKPKPFRVQKCGYIFTKCLKD